MPARLVIGGQWGDEGKGKIVDALAEQAAVVVRATGGNNAGHTILNPLGKFKMHLVPAGVFHPQATSIIGNGVVIDPKGLLDELAILKRAGVDTPRLRISDRAHLVMPWHPLIDKLEEQQRGGSAIGTTGRGIGPAYADRASRTGVRVADLRDEAFLTAKVNDLVERKNKILSLYDAPPLDARQILEECFSFAEQLEQYIAPTEMLVQDALDRGEEVLVEGAQAALLDLDFGTYPYVTSSFPTAAGSCAGAGIAPTQVRETLAVFKAYSTRVGGGPFPTELADATGDHIRERGQEYGTTTGRPRRCGWFDAVAGRYVVRLNDVERIALTRFDILDTLPELRICVGYEANGTKIDHPPAGEGQWSGITPIYETLPGWQSDTSAARSLDELPAAARRYIERIEGSLGARVALIGVGPSREQMIRVDGGVLV
ncbi:MAG: Adenylosuccinate synthetase [uncultured Thermomicrobiales bacterium]|uniref:Adenylosuccinate synthetase n=1 Tax=uncultured Thermomicrobiales bacterium TaxID=1645740 RepID=A0A6J4VZJ2_9BACT|nr:MAG: Adenylosuccinate synthetase [uncultured Thermomicrobiales bacterium]